MQTEGDPIVQLSIPFGLEVDNQAHIKSEEAEEKVAWQEVFPVQPPGDVVIFPRGTTIYRVGGRKWGIISLGSKGNDVVAIDLTGKILYQPKIHPFFLSLVSSSIFIEGRGAHEQVGGSFLTFRASRESGLKGSRKVAVWQLWCQKMHEAGFTWDKLRDSALSRITKTV